MNSIFSINCWLFKIKSHFLGFLQLLGASDTILLLILVALSPLFQSISRLTFILDTTSALVHSPIMAPQDIPFLLCA